MKVFMETASVEAVEDGLDVALCDGVVITSEAAEKVGKGLKKLVDGLVALEVGPIVVTATGRDAEALLAAARALGALGDDLVAALPLDREGLTAAAVCFDEGIATCVGPCLNLAQALAAAKAGATWVSCDLGRIDALGGDAVKLVEDIVSMFGTCDFESQLLVTGVRHAQHLGEVALVGGHAAAVSPEVLWPMLGAPSRREAPPSARVRTSGRRR